LALERTLQGMAASFYQPMPPDSNPAGTQLQLIGDGSQYALGDGVLDDPLLDEDLDEVLETLLQPRRMGPAGGTQGQGSGFAQPAGAPGWSPAKPTVTAAAPPLATTGERSCWGAVLMGSNERCTPSFEIGKGHFKNKYCPNCRTAGVPLPASGVRALASSQHDEWTNDMHLGLWSENRYGGQARTALSPFPCPVPRPAGPSESTAQHFAALAHRRFAPTCCPLCVPPNTATTPQAALLATLHPPTLQPPPCRCYTTVW
jgi:hypothetical protein